jgi:hypothetical protein
MSLYGFTRCVPTALLNTGEHDASNYIASTALYFIFCRFV